MCYFIAQLRLWPRTIRVNTIYSILTGGVEANAVTFNLCRDLVDTWHVVSEEDIKWGMRYVWQEHEERVEGAAGMCVAAVKNMADDVKDKTVCVLLCGGNIDVQTHQDIMEET